MKKFVLSFLLLASSLANAAEVTLLKTQLTDLGSLASAMTSANFFMDQTTGEGFVKVSVSEDRGTSESSDFYTVFKDTVKVEGLMLVDENIIYQGIDGEVNCGKMGVSRIFKRPTIFLNGNCSLTSRINRQRVLTVSLKTK